MSDVKKIDSSAINDIKSINTSNLSGFAKNAKASSSQTAAPETIVLEEDDDNLREDINEFVNKIGDFILDAGADTFDEIDNVLGKYEWYQDFTDFIGNELVPIATDVIEVMLKTRATVDTFGASVLEGVASFGEAIIDFGANLGTAVLSIPTGIADGIQALGGLITGNEWESITKEMWKGTKGFVETKHVKSAFDEFYNSTTYGQFLKNNAYFHDEVRNVGSGVGYTAGIVALTFFTGGIGGAAASSGTATTSGLSFLSSTSGQMATIAAMAGTGKGTEEAWSNGADIGEGLLSGGLTGLWEGLQFYVGGKIGNMSLFGKNGKFLTSLGQNKLGSNLLNSTARIALDSIDGGAEGIVQPLIASIYKDGYYDENGNYVEFKNTDNFLDKYGEIFEDYGGVQNILTNAAVGGGMSLFGEVVDLKKIFNKNQTSNVKDVKVESDIPKTTIKRMDDIHGYQLDINDVTGFYKNGLDSGFFTKEQINNILDNINSKGYLSKETGEYLTNLFTDPDYDVYVKTINDSDLDSINAKGLYCNNYASSIGGSKPQSVKQIDLEATVTKVDNVLDVVSKVKSANGVSQGMNPINGTLILKIPKGASLDDIVYFNSSENAFCIDPKYIDTFLGVDKNGVVGDINAVKSQSLDGIEKTAELDTNINDAVEELKETETLVNQDKMDALNLGEEITSRLQNVSQDSTNVRYFNDQSDIAEYFTDPKQFIISKLDEVYDNNINNLKLIESLEQTADEIRNTSVRELDSDSLYKKYSKYLSKDDKKTLKKLIKTDKLTNNYTEIEQDLLEAYSKSCGPYITAYNRKTVTNFSNVDIDGRNVYAVNEYLGRSFEDINKYSKLMEYTDVDKFVEAMDNIIEKSPALKDDLIVYRSVGDLFMDGKKISTYDVGQKFNDQAFVSTSVIPKKISTKSPICLEIEIPKGTNALYLEKFTGVKNYGQQELLLGRNHEFEITSPATFNPDTGQMTIKARLVTPKESLIKSLSLDTINSKGMALDYYNKFNLKGTEFDKQQIDINEIMNTFKEKGLLGKYESEVRDLYNKNLYNIDIPEHNIDHIERVLFYSMYMGEELGLTPQQMNLLIEAAKYHDSGRINLKTDTNHAEISAKNALNDLYGKYHSWDINKIAAVIEYHEVGDSMTDVNRIFSKYNIDQNEYNDVFLMATILKDADALDRVRFPNNLNNEYLRNDLANKLVKSSYQIQELRAQNILTEDFLNNRYTQEEMDNIVALKESGVPDYLIYMYNRYGTQQVYQMIMQIIQGG